MMESECSEFFAQGYGLAAGARARLRALFLLAFLLAAPLPSQAEKMILRIRAGNPIDKAQKVQIKSPLPSRVTTNHILNLSGLELGYDVNSDTYFVHKSVDLGPKEIVVYDVELVDLWNIPPESLESLTQHAQALTAAMKDKPVFADAERLQASVQAAADAILTSQKKNSIGAGAQPIQHIRAYELNLEQLTRMKKDIAKIENLALASEIDPGSLIAQEAPQALGVEFPDHPPDAYKTAIWRVTAQNTSPTVKRTDIFIRKEMPPEIQIQDVLDAGGLEVGNDPKTGITYVHRSNVVVGPKGTVSFDVKINDKWNIYGGLCTQLLASAEELLKVVTAVGKFKSIEGDLGILVNELKAIAQEKGPRELNEKYVAFYRDQARRLRDIERRIERIKAQQQPNVGQRRGFSPKAPSEKTTWLVIWIILGFLAVMALLSMLRWMVRTKADRKLDSTPPPGAA